MATFKEDIIVFKRGLCKSDYISLFHRVMTIVYKALIAFLEPKDKSPEIQALSLVEKTITKINF